MLQLKNIKKDYHVGTFIVHALKGLDLEFRKNEFVSILGPSGCGKTTLLNIIGGLDGYTDGDLVINGKSTKDYKDRDWDSYRNHSIGFVFQSYNLIPHQTVLSNVELSLSLSGVSKKERKERAIKALQDVGLGDQIYKKPTEMSGGQMQRVAIARALVNNPDIILADEPTGALDTETSVAVMEILKEISKDRLIIMVTHNPELAETYSTRIIRMLDGKITNDSKPLTTAERVLLEESYKEEKVEIVDKPCKCKKNSKKEKKPSMSFATSFLLSLQNLFTKKGRTILTAFAGSIGIIGIALIFAVSQGTTNYINQIQEETLSSYPIQLEKEHMSMDTLINAFMGTASSKEEHANDAVYQKGMLYDLVNAMTKLETTENDLKAFKAYLEDEIKNNKELDDAITGIKYTYNYEFLVYTESVDETIIRSDTNELLNDLMIEFFDIDMNSMGNMYSQLGMSSLMMTPTSNLWEEMLSGDNGAPINDMIYDQYDLVYGSWPNSYDEIVLVVDEKNEIDDLTLYALGLMSKDEINALAQAAFNKTPIESDKTSWTYEEVCAREYRVILNSDCFYYNPQINMTSSLIDTELGLRTIYENKGIDLKVTGIIRPNADASSNMLTGSIAYTNLLTTYISKEGSKSEALNVQLQNPTIDIFTGLPFESNKDSLTVEQKATEFDSYIEKLPSDKIKAKKYVDIRVIPDADDLKQGISDMYIKMFPEGSDKISTIAYALVQTQEYANNDVESIKEMLSGLGESYIEKIALMFAEQTYLNFYKTNILMQEFGIFGKDADEQLENKLQNDLVFIADLASRLSNNTFTSEQKALYYDNDILEFSQSTYKDNLAKLGYIDLDDPNTINIFASSFENKELIEDAIAKYNSGVDDLKQIRYTDLVGLLMSSITIIINAITYVLIAFVSVSLIVSSIMIGVITLISVQERTKEIGILRAIGASKKNVSRMFNAETMIIGLASGIVGVGVTYLLCIPINLILHALTDISTLSAVLPIPVAIILIIISMTLTLIAGIIPSRSAAKKDPVVALRTE